jgi:hypothetical protein
MSDKTVNQLNELTSSDFGSDDLVLVWDVDTGTSRRASISTVASVSGTKGGFTFSGGFERRGNPIAVTTTNKWVPLDLSAAKQASIDAPWWPGAAPSNGVDLFGGTALPFGVTRMLDFTQSWDTSGDADVDDSDLTQNGNRVGTLRFDELDTGTTNFIRIDMNITPQIANTTLEFGLWFQPKLSLDGANDGGAFPLPGSPLFFGTGTVGNTYLSRPTTTMYIASSSDQFAYAIPVVKSDNPVIIEPYSMLLQNLR